MRSREGREGMGATFRKAFPSSGRTMPTAVIPYLLTVVLDENEECRF